MFREFTPFGLACNQSDLSAQLLHLRKNYSTVLHEELVKGRGPESSSASCKQTTAQRFLQRAQAIATGGACAVNAFRCG